MAFKPIDPKRDEFRCYLERANVIESLTKLFIHVIKERPEDPLVYIQNNLGDVRHEQDKLAFLQDELVQAQIEIERLKNIIKAIDPEALTNNAKYEQLRESTQAAVATTKVDAATSDDLNVDDKPQLIDEVRPIEQLAESVNNCHITTPTTTAAAAAAEETQQNPSGQNDNTE